MKTEKIPLSCHAIVCVNERSENERTSCRSSGGRDIAKKLKSESKRLGLDRRGVRISRSYCLGSCDSGPIVMLHPQEIKFSQVTEFDVEKIIDVICNHLQNIPEAAIDDV